jgi:hypothetical protein
MEEEANDRAKRMEEAEARAWPAIERLDEKRAKLDQLLVVLAEAQRRPMKPGVSGRTADCRVRAIGYTSTT